MPQTMPNGVGLSINGQWSNGRPIVSSWHAEVIPVSSRPAAVLEYAQVVSNAWATHVCPLLANNYTHTSVDFIDLASLSGTTGSYARPTAAVGGDTGSHVPPSSGLLVRKLVAGSGRSARKGRIFLPGIDEPDVDEDGIVSSTLRTAVVTAFVGFELACTFQNPSGAISSAELVVAHTPSVEVTETKTRRVPNPNGVLNGSPIVGFEADLRLSGIRRRVRG